MGEKRAFTIVLLSIPVYAGPGAISSMIITADKSINFIHQTSLLVPIAVVSLIVWITLRLSSTITQLMGMIGINIITRLMGLILAAMSVEFIAHGITGLFPKLA